MISLILAGVGLWGKHGYPVHERADLMPAVAPQYDDIPLHGGFGARSRRPWAFATIELPVAT